jgi:hypothetical protein
MSRIGQSRGSGDWLKEIRNTLKQGRSLSLQTKECESSKNLVLRPFYLPEYLRHEALAKSKSDASKKESIAFV